MPRRMQLRLGISGSAGSSTSCTIARGARTLGTVLRVPLTRWYGSAQSLGTRGADHH